MSRMLYGAKPFTAPFHRHGGSGQTYPDCPCSRRHEEFEGSRPEINQ